MRTPISYYGGKQNLVKYILPLIPSHKIYVEPFVGGGAVFWKKNISETEYINDLNKYIINFYKQLKCNYNELNNYIQSIMHSEEMHIKSKEILKRYEYECDNNLPHTDKDVEVAWALWIQCNLSYLKVIYGGFAFAITNNECEHTANRKHRFLVSNYQDRIKNVNIFNKDAIEVIKDLDNEDVFFYLDPPYADSDCGHYKGKEEVFYRLLDLLPQIKGKWLLSSYPDKELFKKREQFGWNSKDIVQPLLINRNKTKTECLTTNYNFIEQQMLF